jgi:anti-sigma-K factor RskA
MATLVGMATTVGNQPFSSIVDSRKTTSWSVGVPIAIAVVIAVALVAYFAAKNTQAREELAQVQQASQQQQQQLTQVQQRFGQMEGEINRLHDPGRTTVILQSVAKKGKTTAGPWGAATWGEQPDGKSWLRLDAYGLTPAPSGKAYQVWFVSAGGDSILAGKIEPNIDGNAYVEGRDLPGVDQGKMALVSIDDENAKTQGQPLFQAALPKLTPSQHAEPAASKADAQAQPGAKADAQAKPDAKSGAQAGSATEPPAKQEQPAPKK